MERNENKKSQNGNFECNLIHKLLLLTLKPPPHWKQINDDDYLIIMILYEKNVEGKIFLYCTKLGNFS